MSERELNLVIAQNITKLLEKHNRTQLELAEYMQVSQATVSNWCNGIKTPRMDKIDKICSFFDVRRSALMNDPDDPTTLPPYDNIHPLATRSFPVLGAVACGEPILMSEEIELYVDSTVEIKADYVLIAKGDSMINARIHDGDIVFVRKQDTVENGEIAVVSIDDEATLKRFYYDDASRTVTLVAENPSYAPMVFGDDYEDRIHIMGKAVAFQSDVK